jgi:hypothetical protein
MLNIKDSNKMLYILRDMKKSITEAISWAATIGRYPEEIQRKAIQVQKQLDAIKGDLALANLQMNYVREPTPKYPLEAGKFMRWKEVEFDEYFNLIKTSDEKPLLVGQGLYWKRDYDMIARCDSTSFYIAVTTIKTSRSLGA